MTIYSEVFSYPGGEQLFDFTESSSWPVRSIDVELNLELAKSGSPRFVLFSRSSHTMPKPKSWLADARSSAEKDCKSWDGLAVFGVHGATSLEPASAILAVHQDLVRSEDSRRLTVRFYGHPCPSYAKTSYLCQWTRRVPAFAEGLVEDDPVAEVLSDLVDLKDRHVDQQWDLHQTLGRLTSFLQADSFTRRSLWLCSGPAVLCAMLHIVSPSKKMIMWHCRHLLDGLGAQSNSTVTALLLLCSSMQCWM